MKYKIEHNSVEETLILPLYARYIAELKYPNLKGNRNTKNIIDSIDYDFKSKEKKMTSKIGLYGTLECIQREYDLKCEILDYLKKYPYASVVNLGCGLLDIYIEIDNKKCSIYNIDFESVINVRNKLIPLRDREINIASDLNDYSWMDKINKDNGVIFIAAGVFYYFKREDAKKLFLEIPKRFTNSSLVFDTCNKKGLKLMLKTWLKEAGIKDVGAYFGLSKPKKELDLMQIPYKNISIKSYMHGYRKLKYIFTHKICNIIMDKIVKGRIIRLDF